MEKYLNDDTRRTEPPVPVTGGLKRIDILRFMRDTPCLSIGCVLLIVYAILLLLDMAAIYPTVHIIGVCGFIFILFYLETSSDVSHPDWSENHTYLRNLSSICKYGMPHDTLDHPECMWRNRLRH